MSNIKMSDAFNLPVEVNRGGDLVFESLFSQSCAVKAINNHDRLTEENAQLKADKAELVTLLESIPDNYVDVFEWFEANNHYIDDLIQKHKTK